MIAATNVLKKSLLAVLNAFLGQILRFISIDFVGGNSSQGYILYILLAGTILLMGWSIYTAIKILIRFFKLEKDKKTNYELYAAILSGLALFIIFNPYAIS